MIRFGGTVTLNGLVVYVANNFEKILLGRYWESTRSASMEEHTSSLTFRQITSIRQSVRLRSRRFRDIQDDPHDKELLPERVLSGSGANPADYNCLCAVCG